MLACPRCRVPLGDCACVWPGGAVRDLYFAGEEAESITAREQITGEVGQFYEEHPFPDYRPADDLGALVRAGRANPFLRALDDEIPPGANVLEAGCGTGQLSNFLGAGGRVVIGLDLSRASLQRAEAFRARAEIDTVKFIRGDLFHPPILPESVDVLISNGVLHHTADPHGALALLSNLVRPGGYLLIGLYNRYARLLLPLLRREHAAAVGARAEAWFHDQHAHPRESRHTIDEVLGWADALDLEFVRCVPSLGAEPTSAQICTPEDRGVWLQRWLVQLSWLGRARDGGLWVTVLRRPG